MGDKENCEDLRNTIEGMNGGCSTIIYTVRDIFTNAEAIEKEKLDEGDNRSDPRGTEV